MKHLHPQLLVWLMVVLIGCGSAEAIKRYYYPISKQELDIVLQKVFRTNPHIIIDTAQPKVLVRRNPDNPNDTSTILINQSDYHERDSTWMADDEKGITRLAIKNGQVDNYYVFRYLGDSKYWETSPTSTIFIQYAEDKHGNSISQGENAHGEFKTKIAHDFISVFEQEVISKLDRELNLKR